MKDIILKLVEHFFPYNPLASYIHLHKLSVK